MNRLELCHVDTCLPDYWGGHHLPHMQVPIPPGGITIKELKESLKSELNQDAIAGSELDVIESEEFHKKAMAAINRIQPAVKGQRKVFTDIEGPTDGWDCGDTVCAFFVFVELD